MRRNLLTITLWLTAIILFLLQILITRKREEESLRVARLIQESQSKVKDMPTSLQKTTEGQPMLNRKEEHPKIKQLKKTIDKLKQDISGLKRKEKQLKNLARRLAAKLKGKESGLLPKLDPKLPWIFAITPTYARFTQKADLVRLSQTLMHVTNLHWIIIEDSTYRTELVSRFLHETGLSFTHLNTRTPPEMQRKKGESRRKNHRGVLQRNLGLQWLRENVDPDKTPGVVYFMDDDNTYHIKIFDEMRWTKRVSVWPVGLTGGARWAGPIVENGKVVRFHTNWAPERAFPIDMAAFAINLRRLVKERPWVAFNSTVAKGFLEPSLLQQLTTIDELEPVADNCTKVLVWHTRTEVAKDSIRGERRLIKEGKPSDLSIET